MSSSSPCSLSEIRERAERLPEGKVITETTLALVGLTDADLDRLAPADRDAVYARALRRNQ